MIRLEGSRTVDLPQDFIARRQYDEVVFEKKRQQQELKKCALPFNEWVTFGMIRIYLGELALCDDSFITKVSASLF